MKKRIVYIICIVLCIITFIVPLCVCSEEETVGQKSTLVLTYSKDGVVFSDIEINIYRIATAKDDGSFEMLEPYDKYQVQLNGITSQAEWGEVAATLNAYVQADSVAPYKMERTDTEGRAEFRGLEEGLYLVAGVCTASDTTSYTFYDFMISLPAREGDAVNYNVSAKPKSGTDKITDTEKKYTITKLWRDGASDNRPTSVTVDILKNGRVHNTVVLNQNNNWSYTFTADTHNVWSVAERNVPPGYTVKVTEKQTSFTVINTLDSNESVNNRPGNNQGAPQTGDTFPMKLYMLIFCISGLLMVVLGIGIRRKHNAHRR